ncbi:MAG: alpha-E domain-containing protein [Pseudomonadota bacterium]|nr:alpha-E domain-containing protein [Pseudomonadota bacterium]
MLSRTAENLFWMARYIERAESTARLMEMGQRMAMLPGAGERDEWRSVVTSCGSAHHFDDGERITEVAAARSLVLDPENPSSIRACLAAARANGKAVRTALTREMWEGLNDGWRKLEAVDDNAQSLRRELPELLDWTKRRANLFRGAAETSMLRNDGWDFMRIGGFIERADMILRLLDVKYFVLLPETDVVGGGRDHHQWTSVLHATSATRAFHHVYKGDYAPWQITDFLLLNRAFPRSLSHCYRQTLGHLEHIERRYGARHPCHDTARAMVERLEGAGMGELFKQGLHEFVSDALGVTARLSREIKEAYHF